MVDALQVLRRRNFIFSRTRILRLCRIRLRNEWLRGFSNSSCILFSIVKHLHDKWIWSCYFFSKWGCVFFLGYFLRSSCSLGLRFGVFLNLSHSLIKLRNAVGEVSGWRRGSVGLWDVEIIGRIRVTEEWERRLSITLSSKWNSARVLLGKVVNGSDYIVSRRFRRTENLRLKAYSVNRRRTWHLNWIKN